MDTKNENFESIILSNRLETSLQGLDGRRSSAPINTLGQSTVTISYTQKSCSPSEYENTCYTSSCKYSAHDTKIMYGRMTPQNRYWLRVWKILTCTGILLSLSGYIFYVIGLFLPILYVEDGQLSNRKIFTPLEETLPHSLVTLYRQKAYFTVAVALIFSVLIPFLKIIVTLIANLVTVSHRRRQLAMFFGKKSECAAAHLSEEDGYIKYAREMLLVLKLISKFQMVDVIILLMNIVFLRGAFLWARPGDGLTYLIIYCFCSIAGAQMINFAVEGERNIFEYWHLVRYAAFLQSVPSTSYTDGHEVHPSYSKPIQHDGFNKWYLSADFICLLAGLNILSCVSIMSNEKLMTVMFTADLDKILGLDATTFSYGEIMLNLQKTSLGKLYIVILFFFCILFQAALSILFLAGIFAYNLFIRSSYYHSHRRNAQAGDITEQNNYEEFGWEITYTKSIFKICNVISEWSCGDVLALGTVAAYHSMTTADRVIVSIPPKNTCSALLMMGVYGISSFLLSIIFHVWNMRIRSEFSDIRILVTHLGPSQRDGNSRLYSPPKGRSSDFKGEGEIMPPCSKRSRSSVFIRFVDFLRSILYSRWISSLFFAVLALITLLLAISAYTLSAGPAEVDEVKINSFLKNQLPEIFLLAEGQIPKSYGFCGHKDSPPPSPCLGDKSVFEIRKGIYFDITWISNIDTVRLEDSEFSITPEKRFQLKFSFTFDEINAYTKCGVCIGQNCKTLIDGPVRSCGTNIIVRLVLSASCSNRRPQIRDLVFESVEIENIEIFSTLPSFIRVIFNSSKFIADHIRGLLNDALKGGGCKIVWRGIVFDAIEMVNLVLIQNFPSDIICPS